MLCNQYTTKSKSSKPILTYCYLEEYLGYLYTYIQEEIIPHVFSWNFVAVNNGEMSYTGENNIFQNFSGSGCRIDNTHPGSFETYLVGKRKW